MQRVNRDQVAEAVAVGVVAEKHHIDEEQREARRHQCGDPPRPPILHLQKEEAARDEFQCDKAPRRHFRQRETQNVEAIDVSLERVDGDEFQHRRQDEHRTQQDADDRAKYIENFHKSGLDFWYCVD